MKIYNYDVFTKEYIGESEASLDPEESKIQGKNIYLIPDYSTTKKPPSVGENEVQIFENSWKIVADYRGKYIVGVDMKPEIVEEIGSIKDGFIIITDEQAHKIEEDDLYYIISDSTLVENPDYEEQAQARRRSILDQKTLTPADVERALYKAKGMDFEDLKALIAQQIPSIDIKALAIEFRAKDFYRGATANGIRLFDIVGRLLGYTTDDMDYLFEHKELPNEVENV